MTFNLLSILLSIAMMLSGAAGLEADAPMANSLTIRDVYLDYNDTNVALDPSLTAGVMTDNGTAVFDFSMACGEESLFPLQLVITEDAATLVVEKTGQAFSMDAETINALVAEALDLDSLEMDAEITEAFDLLADSFNLSLTEPEIDVHDAALNARIYEMLEPVETGEGTAFYGEDEYAVTTKHYILNNDQMFEIVDIVYSSNEQVSNFYDRIVDAYNEAMAMDVAEGEEPAKAESLKDIYAQMGMTISMDLVESTSDDGVFTQASGSVTLNGEALPEPLVILIDAYEVDGITDTLVEFEYTVEGMTLYAGAVAYADDTDMYFEAVAELMPVESETLAEDDYTDTVSIYITGYSSPGEDDNTESGLSFEVSTFEGAFAVYFDSIQDEEGNSSTDIAFDFADDTDTISCGLTLDHSKAVFANAADGIEPIAVTPETIDTVEAEFEPVLESLMVDLQTLIEDESITEMIAAFTAINSADYATSDLITSEAAPDDSDDLPANTELTFDEPEFTYIPDGMHVEDAQIDVEYNSASYTITDDEYDNVIYVYIYGDMYSSDTTAYTLGADGTFSAIEDPIVVTETDEDALYAEMQDNGIIISLSCFGDDMDLDTVSKILSGMVY